MIETGLSWTQPLTLIHILHIFSAFFMCGLCWMVQVAHYPLFREIRLEDFPAYERKNVATAYVTVPMMTVELLTGAWLLYVYFDPMQWINVGLLATIWLSTVLLQVPIHLQLMNNASPRLITRLIRSNWIRTLAWTLRSLLWILYLFYTT